jgi:hypothetical protein
MHARATNEDFDLGTEFMKKGSGFQRALASANDDYAFIRKARQVWPLRGMRGERRRNMVECSRTGRERRDTPGNDHAGGGYIGAILKAKLVSRTLVLNGADFTRVHLRNCGALIPQTVVNEALKRDWGGKMIATAYLVGV